MYITLTTHPSIIIYLSLYHLLNLSIYLHLPNDQDRSIDMMIHPSSILNVVSCWLCPLACPGRGLSIPSAGVTHLRLCAHSLRTCVAQTPLPVPRRATAAPVEQPVLAPPTACLPEACAVDLALHGPPTLCAMQCRPTRGPRAGPRRHFLHSLPCHFHFHRSRKHSISPEACTPRSAVAGKLLLGAPWTATTILLPSWRQGPSRPPPQAA